MSDIKKHTRKFEIVRREDGRYYWRVKARNGEIVAMSAGGENRMYKQLAALVKELRHLFTGSVHEPMLEVAIWNALQEQKRIQAAHKAMMNQVRAATKSLKENNGN